MSSEDSHNQTSKFDRIRAVAMTVRDPKNAGEIAASAGVARNTAEKYLKQLVEADKLVTVHRGRETCYYPDPVTQYFDQIRDLVNEHQKEELTEELAGIRDDIDEWKEKYNVESADELRATVGDEISASERKQRRHDAEDWEYFEHQATLIKEAIQLYDSIEATRDRSLASAT
jgi:sugar-specific transcriptional regulator TrmB